MNIININFLHRLWCSFGRLNFLHFVQRRLRNFKVLLLIDYQLTLIILSVVLTHIWPYFEIEVFFYLWFWQLLLLIRN